MKTIYLDSDFLCHLDFSPDRIKYKTDYFDEKCDAYIEGYRVVPPEYTWTRSDGTVFNGLLIAPAIDFNLLNSRQLQYEEDADTMMPLDEIAELVDMIYEADMEVIEG